MAWLFQQPGSSKWYIGYRVDGKMFRKSTGRSDKAEAEAELARHESLAAAKRANVTFEHAYEALSGKTLPRITLHAQVASWLAETRRSVSGSTQVKYEGAGARLIAHLKATDRGPLLSEIAPHQLQQYLETRAKAVSATSTNLDRTILRIFFKRATDTGILKTNPIQHIEPFRETKDVAAAKKLRKRTFTAGEMLAIYQAAPSDFWRYMIVGGAYTGMRMGDLITLRIEEVDMQTHWIHREMGKVQGQFVHVPMVPILVDLLHQQIQAKRYTLEANDDETEAKRDGLEAKRGFIWPKQAAQYNTAGARNFSKAFGSILTRVGGIIDVESKKERDEGDLRRDRGASFHLLRHFFVSELKAAGANSAVAKALAGHSSDAINELYTHLPTETLSQAVRQIPNFLKDSPTPARITQ